MLGLAGAAERGWRPTAWRNSTPVDETAPRSEASLSAGEGDSGPADAPTARDLQQARDIALVGRSLDGELEAFNELVAVYQDYLFALVVRVVGDRDSAADAVQEAFFSAYRNLARFRGDSFRSWLTRIAINAATDILRQRKRRPVDP